MKWKNSIPVAAAALSGPDRTGVLALPAPRPTYAVSVRRTETGAMVELRHGDAVSRVHLTRFNGGLEPVTLEPVDDVYHAIRAVDGYVWRFRADEHMRLLEVFDHIQPSTLPRAVVDDRGVPAA